MQKSFSFKGITRNSDNLLVADGECMELINLRVKEGCLEPLPSEYNETELERCYEKVYWHSAANMYLCIEYKNEGRVNIYDKDLKIVRNESTGGVELFPLLTQVHRIEFAGKIVCCVAEKTTYYLIYDVDKYRWLGELPELPELSISYESVVYESVSDDEYEAGLSFRNEDTALRWENVSKGYFDQTLSMLHSRGYYVDRALFRYALRLFDGNYICYSPIYYVDDNSEVDGLGRDSNNFQSGPLVAGTLKGQKVTKIQGFLPDYHLKELNLAAWENIIVSVDIFTSGSIYGHKIVDSKDEFRLRDGSVLLSRYSGVERYVGKTGLEIMNDVQEAASFYKVAEYSIYGVQLDRVENVSLSSLALCETLPDESGSQVTRGAAYSYFFNGRLHLAGIREVLMKGYSPCAYLPANSTSCVADYAIVATRLKTTLGTSVVRREFVKSFTLAVDGEIFSISPYIMYPDVRAFETIFIISVRGVVFRKSFPLKQHKILNLAHYVNASGNMYDVSLECNLSVGTKPSSYSVNNILAYFSYIPGVYEIVYVSGGIWYYGDQPFVLHDGPDGERYYRIIMTLNPQPGDTIKITIGKRSSVETITGVGNIIIDDTWEVLEEVEDIAEENTCEVRGNVMKVSAVDNPFFFAAKNTYQPSREDIVAMCSNTVTLSQGQFGQHPLYVFCRDGIWVMQSDLSGNLTYLTALPLSYEVCVNADSVCYTPAGIVFLSKRGLMLLKGNTLKTFSDAVDVDSHFMQRVVARDLFYRVAMVVGNQYSLSRESFREYIKSDLVVGYIQSENEVWISCPDYNYSYIYSLDNGSWTKISKSFVGFVNTFPHQSFVRIIDDKSYIATIDKDNAGPYSPVTLFTRPQLWGTKLPKRILQFMLHASIKAAATGSSYEYGGLACYLLCSNDGIHFKLVAGVEKSEDFNDIVFPYFPTQAYKYYVIALSGAINLDSRIVGAELSVATAWENRLR
ncbi:MAG: hypothetical protein IJZ22_07765 [Bacteroidaceae bacterium]|nr:hypothetical protein [Bacteroidaceae bacterium]